MAILLFPFKILNKLHERILLCRILRLRRAAQQHNTAPPQRGSCTAFISQGAMFCEIKKLPNPH